MSGPPIADAPAAPPGPPSAAGTRPEAAAPAGRKAAHPYFRAPGGIGPDRLRDAVRAWAAQRALIATFIRTDLKNRYGAAALGLSWSVLEPLLLIAIYALLFSVILQVKFPGEEGHGGFVVYLMCALIPWLAVSESIQRCVDCLRDNSNLLKKVYFAPGILPISIVAANLLVESIGLAIFTLFLLIVGRPLSLALLALPLTILLQVPLTLGVCWAVATWNVFHRDVKHFVSLALLLWLFVTPIFYPSTLLVGRFDWLLELNPLALIVDMNREILLHGAFPSARAVGIVLAENLAILVAGARLFVHRQHEFADLV